MNVPPFLGVLPALLVFAIGTSAAAQSVPSEFKVEPYGGRLSDGTAMACAPDGRLFVGQRDGAVRIIKNGTLLATPFHTATVDMGGQRGLLGLCLDPDFAGNGYVYIYFAAPLPMPHNCVRRLMPSGPGSDVSNGSETAILDLETLGPDQMHMGGAIRFGGDRKLYVATGDNADAAHAQSLASRFGKILRYNSDGSIPSDNPMSFPNIPGAPSGEFRAIWAVGLRNPFRFAFQPGSMRMFINDVGVDDWEEINDGVAGANFGWVGGNTDGARNLPGMTDPVYQYGHAGPPPVGVVITAGAFYNPPTAQFPSTYVGRYFFADYRAGWVYSIHPAAPRTAEPFVRGAMGIVDMATGPDGALYYLSRTGNAGVSRISYDPGSSAPGDPPVTPDSGGGGCGLTGFETVLFILALLRRRRS